MPTRIEFPAITLAGLTSDNVYYVYLDRNRDDLEFPLEIPVESGIRDHELAHGPKLVVPGLQ